MRRATSRAHWNSTHSNISGSTLSPSGRCLCRLSCYPRSLCTVQRCSVCGFGAVLSRDLLAQNSLDRRRIVFPEHPASRARAGRGLLIVSRIGHHTAYFWQPRRRQRFGLSPRVILPQPEHFQPRISTRSIVTTGRSWLLGGRPSFMRYLPLSISQLSIVPA